MCLPFLWFLSSLDYITTPLLSQNSIMGCITKDMTLSSMRNFLSQTVSFAAVEATTSSTSIVELAMQDYLTLLKLITIPPKVKTKQERDRQKSLLD